MRLLAAELLKLRTTRVVYVLLAVALVVSGLTAVAIAASDVLEDDRALALADAVSFSTVLAIVVGILLTTNEYRHGTIASTFLATPSRTRVLGAKLLAGAIAGVAFAIAVALFAYGIAVPWLFGGAREIPVDGQLLEGVGRLVAAYVLSVLVGVAAGAIFQNQVGAIVVTFGWLFVAESLLRIFSSLADVPLEPYLLGSAFTSVTSGADQDVALRTGWGLLLGAAWTASLSAAGAVSMVRRDPA
jgi:ABC-2 type transport system permease protein